MVLGGLLKSVAKATYGTFEKVFATAVTVPANIISAGIAKITPLTSTPMTSKEFSESAFGQKVTRAAAVPAAGLIIAAGAGGRVATALKSLIPKTIGGKIIGGTAALAGYGILKGSPKAQSFIEGTIEGLPDKPSKIVTFGESVGGVIEGEQGFSSKDVVRGLTTAGIVGGILGAGALIIPKLGGKSPQETGGLIEAPIGQEQYTILPSTVDIIDKPKKKTSYKRRRATKTPSIRQSVRVNVINKATSTGQRRTQTYINRKLYN